MIQEDSEAEICRLYKAILPENSRGWEATNPDKFARYLLIEDRVMERSLPYIVLLQRGTNKPEWRWICDVVSWDQVMTKEGRQEAERVISKVHFGKEPLRFLEIFDSVNQRYKVLDNITTSNDFYGTEYQWFS